MTRWESFRETLWRGVPYAATLLYIEIIYLMFMLSFLYGRTAGIVTGVIAALLLSVQVVALFNRVNLCRKIQLYIMDIHFAYSVAFIINRLLSGFTLSSGDITMTVFRGVAAAVELPIIILLTDEFIISRYR